MDVMPDAWAARAAQLDAEDRPRAARLLSGVAFCAHCGRRMYVRTQGSKAAYGCSAITDSAECVSPRIDADLLDAFVSEVFLRRAGSAPETEDVEIVSDPGTIEELGEIEAALTAATGALMADEADVPVLLARLEALKARRTALRPVVDHGRAAPDGPDDPGGLGGRRRRAPPPGADEAPRPRPRREGDDARTVRSVAGRDPLERRSG